jgi:heme-degrading monooxygenase HmoA
MTANNRGVLLLVRFKSALPLEEVKRRYRERMPQFRAQSGLIQKYYAHDDETGEWAGVYFWDSRRSLDEFLASDLRKSIPDTYEIEGAPRVEVIDVIEELRG